MERDDLDSTGSLTLSNRRDIRHTEESIRSVAASNRWGSQEVENEPLGKRLGVNVEI